VTATLDARSGAEQAVQAVVNPADTVNLGFLLQSARRRVDKECENGCGTMMRNVTVARRYCSNRCQMQAYRKAQASESAEAPAENEKSQEAAGEHGF